MQLRGPKRGGAPYQYTFLKNGVRETCVKIKSKAFTTVIRKERKYKENDRKLKGNEKKQQKMKGYERKMKGNERK